jgi:hypothetical protein
MECQQDTYVQLVELSTRVSRLTEAMDQIASQIDVLTKLTLSTQSQHKSNDQGSEGTRRRTIDEMSIFENQQKQQAGAIAQMTMNIEQADHKTPFPAVQIGIASSHPTKRSLDKTVPKTQVTCYTQTSKKCPWAQMQVLKLNSSVQKTNIKNTQTQFNLVPTA